MRVWIDIANTPHVGVFDPVVDELRALGVPLLLTARDHAQTAELARERWPDVIVIGGESPAGRWSKGASTVGRSVKLARVARGFRPDVALSHGSYAQVVAARLLRTPAVTMMDYEYQPANHLSFRLADRVIVPAVFPAAALKRFGAGNRKVRRYEGFKEELYLARFVPAPSILASMGVDASNVVVVLRPPPIGALYHPEDNDRFDEAVARCAAQPDVSAILLPRSRAQRAAYARVPGLTIPERAVEGLSLLASADVVIGAGGTMNREAALLGTQTFTLFAGRLAAVDARLLELGYMHDLRANGALPALEKRRERIARADPERSAALLRLILETVEEAAHRGG
ncbi:MAG: DUF354 domain-containing protein [Gaiellaceae bacterium]